MNAETVGRGDGFPPKTSLWRGSLLASIAHAVFVARAPFLAYSQSWDGRNYSLQDSTGSYGTTAFGRPATALSAFSFYVQVREIRCAQRVASAKRR
jgi:hypothetical protein